MLPSNDPLDQPDFDPIAYINATFPDQLSLDRLRPFTATMQKQIAKLDEEIYDAVREQSSSGRQVAEDIRHSKAAIKVSLHTPRCTALPPLPCTANTNRVRRSCRARSGTSKQRRWSRT